MRLNDYVPDPLNPQASVLVDVQTDIKLAIKRGVLGGASFPVISKEIQRLIDNAIKRIRSPTLKKDARVSLLNFADKIYAKFKADINIKKFSVLAAVLILMGENVISNTRGIIIPKTERQRKAVDLLARDSGLEVKTISKGIPLQEYQKNYFDKVEAALNNLAESYAIDPNDFSGRNSLRNLAEMQVRYERHQDDIADFKARGVRLVVCSVHADCSDRCKNYQGRVYSMNGTEGYTEDGNHYVPLEEATDIYYPTKAGKVYKNGLLGFNCRHKLYEYKVGMVIPSVDEETQKREYAITQKQRAMERSVVSAREIALCFKDVGGDTYKKWRKIAIERNRAYKKFSIENNRAYYPDRVKVL